MPTLRATQSMCDSAAKNPCGSPGARICPKRKTALAIINPEFFELLFGFANGGNFRIRVNHTCDRIVIDVTASRHKIFRKGDPFFLGFVGQHRPNDHIADGVDIVFRLGALKDSSLVALRLGEVRQGGQHVVGGTRF